MELKSRYGDVWRLEETEEGYIWKDVPDYTRMGLFPDSEDTSDISFIDPPGGPFLEVGREIREGEIILEIRVPIEYPTRVIIKTHKKEG